MYSNMALIGVSESERLNCSSHLGKDSEKSLQSEHFNFGIFRFFSPHRINAVALSLTPALII